MTAPYEIVIGLEVHVQLLTRSKLFCGCDTRFGAPPNAQTCPVCIGLPGALPVLNGRAVELALRTAVALGCHVGRLTKWDRKNYYYPDLPKGYQISQYDLPMSRDGYLDVADAKGRFEPLRVRILRAHLEEDAGKSMHDEAAAQADSRIDLNRTGTPLLEIVTQPDLRSPAQARAFLAELRLVLVYLGVSDCNMQEGSLRVDANVNLHVETPQGRAATPIVEVKNMNSFRAVERALEYEAARQWEVWQETGQKLGEVPKQTRGWDDQANLTRAHRQKEESSDYRYFPDPDLVPVRVSAEEVEQARAALGELPAALRARLVANHGLTPYDAEVLVNQGRATVEYFEELARLCGDGKLASNWVQQDVLRVLNEQGIGVDRYPVRPPALAELLSLVRRGDLDTSRAREVLGEMLSGGATLPEVLQSRGFRQVDEAELRSLCAELLAANPQVVAEYKAGKEKAALSLVGQAKKRNPHINPGRFRELLLAALAEQ
jgi:aspartyl-tRNA(Asn)/glutamyl-tRNA(Gln) amidotransferase subunit B